MADVDEVAFPALLRAARGPYRRAVRSALDAAGCDDLPANGPYVLGAIARTDAALGEIIAALGLSKQAAGALVDALVARGYLDRAPDPADRRRVRVSLTARGSAAAAVVRDAIDRVDARLCAQVGTTRIAHARETLVALASLDDE